jgi:hypothetical protein
VLFEICHDSRTKHQRKIASERLENRDQSFARIFGRNDTVVELDRSFNAAIMKLRIILGMPPIRAANQHMARLVNNPLSRLAGAAAVRTTAMTL